VLVVTFRKCTIRLVWDQRLAWTKEDAVRRASLPPRHRANVYVCRAVARSCNSLVFQSSWHSFLQLQERDGSKPTMCDSYLHVLVAEFRAGKAYVQPWRESHREEGGFLVILAFIFATTRKGWIEACNVRFVPPHPGRRVSSGQGLHAALERERAIEREGRREEDSGGGWGVGEIK
jgi:hypothetical protein